MGAESLVPLKAAGLLVTTWCPARCRHCYVCSGPERSAWMAVEDARGYLASLARLGVPAEGVHIGGGEPFGRFDRLLEIVRAARDVGLGGVGYVETCGWWATDERIVRDRLGALAEAGMRQISISADPYHQEFVSPDRVRRLYGVARAVLGPRGVRARRWTWLKRLWRGGDPSASLGTGSDPPRGTRQDVAAMPETARRALFADFLRRYPERMTGRAALHLAPLLDRTPVEALPDEGCRDRLLASRHVHVLPGGWVYPGTCAGIVLGRASSDAPLDSLLGRWRPTDSPLVARLVSAGPKALLQEAQRCGFTPDPAGYADNCHLCWSIRRHMVRAGAGGRELGPPEIYGEDPGTE